MDFFNQSYDVIVLAGQSNAEGTGRGCVEAEYEPDNDIISLSPVYTISRKIENEVSKRAIIYADEPFCFEIASERIVNESKYGDLSLIFAKNYIIILHFSFSCAKIILSFLGKLNQRGD